MGAHHKDNMTPYMLKSELYYLFDVLLSSRSDKQQIRLNKVELREVDDHLFTQTVMFLIKLGSRGMLSSASKNKLHLFLLTCAHVEGIVMLCFYLTNWETDFVARVEC